MQVDVGLGDVVTPNPVEITYPALLELPAPELVAYPVETAIAEKLEAVVDLGMANSRMKDFFDLWSLLGNLDLDGPTVASAIGATFARRGTAIPSETPVGLRAEFASDADKQKQWLAFVRRLRLVGQPGLPEIVPRIERFAMPIFESVSASATRSARWSAGQGWME
jgi:hypothetical protein